jgi:hypothetical protein
MMTRRDAALAAPARQALDAGPPRPSQPPAAPKSRGRLVRDRYATFPGFILVLANRVQHEQFPPSASPVECVRALGRHHPAFTRLMRAWRAPAARGSSPLVLVPFLIAGFYLGRMLTQVARAREHRPTQAFAKALDDGEDALETRWGTYAFARELFPNVKDQDAWLANCGSAVVWLQRLALAPHDSLALVRRCKYSPCAAPIYLYRRGRLNAGFCKAHSGRGRQAKLRALRTVRPPAVSASRPARPLVSK